MISQAFDNSGCFLLQNREIFIGSDVIVAGKRKFLPHHDPHFIAKLVKYIFIYHGSAPDAENIHMSFFCKSQLLCINILIQPSRKQLRIDPVTSFCKQASVVQFDRHRRKASGLGKFDRLFPCTGIHNELYTFKADLSGFLIFLTEHFPCIQVRFSLSHGPPQTDILKPKIPIRSAV